jgi:hypothetical protein
VDDDEGWSIDASPGLWHAVFGIFSAELRPPTIIDQQVRCLRTVLVGREDAVATVHLAPRGDRCGTFRKKPGT